MSRIAKLTCTTPGCSEDFVGGSGGPDKRWCKKHAPGLMTWESGLEQLRAAADPRTVAWAERLFQHHGLTPLDLEERLACAYRLARDADERVVGMLCGTVESADEDDRERGSIGRLRAHVVYSELPEKKITDEVRVAENAARSAFPEKLWVMFSPRLLSEQRDVEREERNGKYQPMAHRVGLEALSDSHGGK